MMQTHLRGRFQVREAKPNENDGVGDTQRQRQAEGQWLEVRERIKVAVRIRFPALSILVGTQIAALEDVPKLQEILLKINAAQTMKELRTYLLTLSPRGERLPP